MALIVQKFGGATLDSTSKILQAAERIYEQKKLTGAQFVIVVSAMGEDDGQFDTAFA